MLFVDTLWTLDGKSVQVNGYGRLEIKQEGISPLLGGRIKTLSFYMLVLGCMKLSAASMFILSSFS